MRRIISLLLLFALLAPLAPDAAAYPSLNRKEERDIGKQIEREAARSMRTLEDPYALAYIEEIVNRIAKAAHSDEFEVRVHVIQSPLVNAFTVPGGVIFLTTGIIMAMDSEEELAGVIAHEMGHVDGRHIAYRMDKGKMVGIATVAGVMAAMLIGSKIDPAIGQAAFVFSVAGGQTQMLSYSRTDEEDADRRAVKALDAAGYGSAGLATFMEKLGKINPTPNEVPAYLFTHPAPGERSTMIKLGTKAELSKKDPAKTYFWDFQARTATLDQKPYVEKAILDRLSVNGGSLYATLGAAVVDRTAGRFDEAEKKLEEAEKIEPGYTETAHELALIEMRTGRSESGIARLEALRASGKAGFAPLRDLGWAYLEKDRGQDALSVYEEIGRIAPNWYELPYRLGLALGKVGREPEAHLQMGRFYVERDHKTARKHLEKAYAALPEGKKREEAEALLERIKEIEREEAKAAQSRR